MNDLPAIVLAAEKLDCQGHLGLDLGYGFWGDDDRLGHDQEPVTLSRRSLDLDPPARLSKGSGRLLRGIDRRQVQKVVGLGRLIGVDPAPTQLLARGRDQVGVRPGRFVAQGAPEETHDSSVSGNPVGSGHGRAPSFGGSDGSGRPVRRLCVACSALGARRGRRPATL